MKKVTYKGYTVNFYQFERLILEEYGDWTYIPKNSEAHEVWGAWRKEEKIYPELKKSLIKNYNPDPFAEIYTCELDEDRFNQVLNNKGIALSTLAATIGVTNATLKRTYWDNLNSDTVARLEAALPELKGFSSKKCLSKKQPLFNVDKSVIKKLTKEERLKIFKYTQLLYSRKQEGAINATELKRLTELLNCEPEDVLVKNEEGTYERKKECEIQTR